MTVKDPDRFTKFTRKAYKAAKKSGPGKAIRRTLSSIVEKGVVQTTKEGVTYAFEKASEKTQQLSDYGKRIFYYFKREWDAFKPLIQAISTKITADRAAKLSLLISKEQDKIHDQIHGEEMTFESMRALASKRELQNSAIKTIEWRAELMGRQTEMDVMERTIRSDKDNLIIMLYLVEILCNDLPSFELFDYLSQNQKESTLAYINKKINECVNNPSPMAEDFQDTPSVPRPLARPIIRISPNDTEGLMRHSAESAKMDEDKKQMFKDMRARTTASLLKKRKAVKLFKKKHANTVRMKKHKQTLEQQQGLVRELELKKLEEAAGPQKGRQPAAVSGFGTGFGAAPLQVPQPPAGAGVSRGRGRTRAPPPQASNGHLSEGEVSGNGSPVYSPDSPYRGP
jgi:DNA-binding PadR family transcriptional regulator